MTPIDTYAHTAERARTFLAYYDGLINIRARRIRKDWKRSFLNLMHWPETTAIERVDSRAAVLILRPTASLTVNHFSHVHLDDQLRAALTFGVSALDRYVHERVVKGIITALRQRPHIKQQEEFAIPLSIAIEISEKTVAARRTGSRLRPTNIVRKAVQDLLHRRPFQSFREIEYAFNLLGITTLVKQMQMAYGIADISPIRDQLGHIAMRRNQIVHEGDLVRHERGGKTRLHDVTRKYVEESLDFLDDFVVRLESVV